MLRSCCNNGISQKANAHASALLLAFRTVAGGSSHLQAPFCPRIYPLPRSHGSFPIASTSTQATASQSVAEVSTPPAAERRPENGSQQPTNRLALVDAFAILFRTHHAYGSVLKNAYGESTSIVYGFVKGLITLMEITPPITHWAIVFDFSGKNFRHELFRDYKAQRPPMPQEIKDAIPQVEALLRAMQIPILKVPGVEADDVIGCLATRAVGEGFGVAIVSPDKDFFQLLQKNLMILKAPKKNALKEELLGGYQVYTMGHFRREHGLEPSQWADFLALTGDKVDNVPGVSGIGKKWATEYLQQFGTLEAMLERAEEITRPSHKKTLSSEEGRQVAQLSKELVTLQTDFSVPQVQEPLSKFQRKEYSDGEKQDILETLRAKPYEMTYLAKKLQEFWSHQEYLLQQGLLQL